MLSRGGASAAAVGSMNALCGVKRAGTLYQPPIFLTLEKI
jgi:hypothetical protein